MHEAWYWCPAQCVTLRNIYTCFTREMWFFVHAYNRVSLKLVFFSTEMYLAATTTVIYTDELDVKVKSVYCIPENNKLFQKLHAHSM